MRRFAPSLDGLTGRPKTTIVIVLAVILLVSAGGATLEQSTEMEMFDDNPPEIDALDDVHERFGASAANTTTLNVIVRDDDGTVLDRDSLLASLRYQQALLADEQVAETLVDGGVFGIENVVAATAMGDAGGDSADPQSMPPIDAQIEHLEGMSDEGVTALVRSMLDPESEHPARDDLLALLPRGYEPGTAEADGRLLVVTQATDGIVRSPPELSDRLRTAQVAATELATDVEAHDYQFVGYGLMVVEEEESTNDSLALIGPFALVFVLAALGLTYRDVLDVILGFVGIGFVLMWTFGAMGWLGIDITILLVATPVLLIGLSIDYGIHVIMRYREQRAEADPTESIHKAMGHSLQGLVPALALVTITAMIGFLSVLASGVPALSDFGIATAAGILGALLVFVGLIPALKVVLDGSIERRWGDRSRRALGTVGASKRLLTGIVDASIAHPRTIIAIVLLISAAGVVGGTHLEAEYATDDYLAEDPPAWTQELPEGLAPDEYESRAALEYLFEHFQSAEQQIHFVVETEAIDSSTLAAIDTLEREAATTDVTYRGPSGEPAVGGPIGLMHDVATENATFASLLDEADTSGDGVPDRDIDAVLDALVVTAPDRATQYLHRDDTGDHSLRVVAAVGGTISATEIAGEMDAVAGSVDGVDVLVTGEMIVNELVQRQLSTTMLEGLLIALVAVLAVLVVAFRLTRSSATLGVVTIVPVLISMTWLAGAMALLDLPISFATAMIGSIAIGLGVDYAIHMSERFGQELERTGEIDLALERSVVGTGGALLGSAVTTAGGFGVLALSLVPVMQQFGIVIALAIVGAFLASVVALPSFLVIWARRVHTPR